ncbi:MAG TPA: DNA-3-methyladenine glycosylase I [Candidatus Tumulicola sp.]|jgi:DNA-3-methyladenine glycosylase I
MPVPEIPDVVRPDGSADYLEVITRAVFQAGVRWKQIADHWEAYRDAFEGFHIARVATYDDIDIDRVLGTPGVLRMRRKVMATIANARALETIGREHGGVATYLRSFDSYDSLAADIRKRFAFMGEMNVWYFLFRVGEPVPRFESWVKTIRGDHPRMLEMVLQARSKGCSPERIE